MIIEKNMNIKIDLDSDLVSEYFKHCLDNTTELSNIVDKLDDNILSYIAAYYVGKVSREDPEQYAKFKKFLPHSIDDEKSEINPETKDNAEKEKPIEISVGDTVFVVIKKVSPLYLMIGFADEYFERWTVSNIQKSNLDTEYHIITLNAPGKLSIKMTYSEFKRRLKNQEIFIAR